jgi:DNA-binding MarR family transcriptional regulator
MSASQHPGSIVSLVRLTKLVYKQATDDVLGMKLKAYATLSNLRDGDLAQSDLCIAMHMDANNCVLMLNHLEEHGWVERRRDPADRRRHIVCLTETGREAMLRAEVAMESLEGEVLGALSPEERDVLRGLLGRALAADSAAVAG